MKVIWVTNQPHELRPIGTTGKSCEVGEISQVRSNCCIASKMPGRSAAFAVGVYSFPIRASRSNPKSCLTAYTAPNRDVPEPEFVA